jgi:hypothetical protein
VLVIGQLDLVGGIQVLQPCDKVVVEEAVVMHMPVVQVSWIFLQFSGWGIDKQPGLRAGLLSKVLEPELALEVAVSGCAMVGKLKLDVSRSRTNKLNPVLLPQEKTMPVRKNRNKNATFTTKGLPGGEGH